MSKAFRIIQTETIRWEYVVKARNKADALNKLDLGDHESMERTPEGCKTEIEEVEILSPELAAERIGALQTKPTPPNGWRCQACFGISTGMGACTQCGSNTC